jgi:hypothetical protein
MRPLIDTDDDEGVISDATVPEPVPDGDELVDPFMWGLRV